MKSTLSYLLILCSLFMSCTGHQEESLLSYVDTRTGTAPSITHTAGLLYKNYGSRSKKGEIPRFELSHNALNRKPQK